MVVTLWGWTQVKRFFFFEDAGVVVLCGGAVPQQGAPGVQVKRLWKMLAVY